MKLIKNYFILFLSLSLFAACDFMDCDESDNYSLDQIKGNYNHVKQYVTNVYGYVTHDFLNTDGAMQDAATDDAIHVYEGSNIQRFVNGTWSPTYTIDDLYGYYYRGIYDANFYLENLCGLTFDEWKYNIDYEDWMKAYVVHEDEVRYLRAYFYFELVKRYQNIPLITKTLTESEANEMQPASATEILDFIIAECTDVAKRLPLTYVKGFKSDEKGRATKAVALALKARVALYAASPLFNPDNDKKKWVIAAEAAAEIINDNTTLGCALDGNFSNLFGAENYKSSENIWVRSIGVSNGFESGNFPMGVAGGKTSTCPTENLASAFEMVDGSLFDWNKEEMRKNPYANRDPRFYLTIVHNGMKWPKNVAVEVWEGGANALPLPNATVTGYYLRKYVNNNVSFESGQTPATLQHSWVLFRYAEVLLNYAEAMVNAYGDINYTTPVCKMSALDAVNAVRGRNGVKMPTLPKNLSSEEFIKRLKNERRVELAFEGHRFWDLRRWKELGVSKDIYATKITKEGSAIHYEKILLESRKIEDKLYFYPIANSELFKNGHLKQNTGWQ